MTSENPFKDGVVDTTEKGDLKKKSSSWVTLNYFVPHLGILGAGPIREGECRLFDSSL